MKIVIKTVLQQIIAHCAGTQDMIKKLSSCSPFGLKVLHFFNAFMYIVFIQIKVFQINHTCRSFFRKIQFTVIHELFNVYLNL